jgi:hypothetical protein
MAGMPSLDAQGKSYIYRKGVSPNTRTVISQKNKVMAISTGSGGLFTQIGNLSTFNISEARSIETVRGVGMGDRIAELVPSVTDAMEISAERAMLYLQNFHQVFGYKGGAEGLVRSLRHHRWPFDIRNELVISHLVENELGDIAGQQQIVDEIPVELTGTACKAIMTFLEACWLNNYSYDHSADGAIVSESVSITVSDVMAYDTADYASLEYDGGTDSSLSTLSMKSKRFQSSTPII